MPFHPKNGKAVLLQFGHFFWGMSVKSTLFCPKAQKSILLPFVHFASPGVGTILSLLC